MKINVDKKNNRVIATGYFRGQKIRGIALCNGDTWDENIGISIATQKYKMKEEKAKKRWYEKRIRRLHKEILWRYAVIKDEERIVSSLSDKINKIGDKYNAFLARTFG